MQPEKGQKTLDVVFGADLSKAVHKSSGLKSEVRSAPYPITVSHAVPPEPAGTVVEVSAPLADTAPLPSAAPGVPSPEDGPALPPSASPHKCRRVDDDAAESTKTVDNLTGESVVAPGGIAPSAGDSLPSESHTSGSDDDPSSHAVRLSSSQIPAAVESPKRKVGGRKPKPAAKSGVRKR